MCNDKTKRRAFNLAWGMAQLAFDNALLGVSATKQREHKRRCRAKFMEMLSGAKAPAAQRQNV